jgi:hypothetical protein
MLFEPGHHTVELKDWTACFRRNLNPYFSRAICRDQTELPYWFAPLAWGVIVAGPALLLRTACKVSVLGWTRVDDKIYHRSIGKTRLRVRRTNDDQFWLISRWPPGKSMSSDRESETLVHGFGSTPLVTETLIEALHLAYWFQTNDPIGGLRWIKASPAFIVQAIAFADLRAKSEGLTISWNDLWASSSHLRRMKRGGARYRKGKLLLPVIVRAALHTDAQA